MLRNITFSQDKSSCKRQQLVQRHKLQQLLNSSATVRHLADMFGKNETQ